MCVHVCVNEMSHYCVRTSAACCYAMNERTVAEQTVRLGE